MSAADLYAEMKAAAYAVRQPHLDRLRALGVSIVTIAEMGREFHPIGVVPAERMERGLYQPSDGVLHLVLPVREYGGLIDLVAFRSTAPDDWALRVGNGWALGVEWIAEPSPIHIYSNPLDWLQGGCAGICVLDWSSPEVAQLACVESFSVSDPQTARLLQSALSRPARLPNIEVMGVPNVA